MKDGLSNIEIVDLGVTKIMIRLSNGVTVTHEVTGHFIGDYLQHSDDAATAWLKRVRDNGFIPFQGKMYPWELVKDIRFQTDILEAEVEHVWRPSLTAHFPLVPQIA